jgi:hypothetical protein
MLTDIVLAAPTGLLHIKKLTNNHSFSIYRLKYLEKYLIIFKPFNYITGKLLLRFKFLLMEISVPVTMT